MKLRQRVMAMEKLPAIFGITRPGSRLTPNVTGVSVCSSPSADALHTQTNKSTTIPSVDDYYIYSSGRWLWNESSQLESRRLNFDPTELARAAATAVGSRTCRKLEKLSEGDFNKVFLLTMDDNRELIAKLPNPNAGYKHFTTASEVATMDYVSAIKAFL
jgi:hypothetical protein